MEWVPVPRAERDREASSKRELMEERAVVARGVAFPSPGSAPVKYSAAAMVVTVGPPFRLSPAADSYTHLTLPTIYSE